MNLAAKRLFFWFMDMMKFAERPGFGSLGQIGSAAGVRIGLNGIVLAFLGANLWYRFSTVFDYSQFIGGLFIFLGLCSLVVILFPKFLRAFLFLFGASFFLFGFRGYDIQSQMFETIVVFEALTVFFVNLRKGKARGRWSVVSGQIRRLRRFDGLGEKGEDGGRLNRQLVGLMLCYVGLSVLSLMLLPVGHIVKDFWLFGLKSSFLQVANATPNTYLYPLAGINRLILFFVFSLEVSKGKAARELFKWIFVGIFTGGVFCALVGLLDYYGVISLKWYSRTVTGYALSSTFLNRSWLAEFILMMAPFVLIGFMSKIEGVWWKILLLGSLVICEIALILAGARGGWVSYPLILFICWLFFYFSKEGRLEPFHFRWRSVIKVAISVPITIIISFLLIFQVLMPLSDYLRTQKGVKSLSRSSKSTSQYIKTQTARIVEPSGRVRAWTQGIDVGRESPLFGMGYEAFCWHANMLSGLPDSYYTINKANKHNKVLDTPHNIFFQLFVSGGVVGICFWALIMGYGLTILVVDLVRNKRLLNVPVIISIISFHTYGIFQSMQYIPMIWMFIFLNLGYAMTLDEKVLPERIRRLSGFVLKVMVFLVLIGGVVYFADRGSQGLAEKYGLKVYATDQDWHTYHGFYHREKFPDGYYRWSGAKGRIVVGGRESPRLNTLEGDPVQLGKEVEGRRAEDGAVVEFDVQCHTPGVEKEPVEVVVWLDGGRIDEIVFDKRGSVRRWYYVGRDGEAAHEFLFEVSRTWNSKKMGISADLRDLGAAVSEPKVLKEMPKDGVGFYGWEIWGGGGKTVVSDQRSVVRGKGKTGVDDKGGKEEEEGRRFRWTGMRASVGISDQWSVVSGQGKDSGRGSEVGLRPGGAYAPEGGQKADIGGQGKQGERGKVLFLKCSHPDIGKEAVVVKILGNQKVIREERFEDHGWKKVEFKGDELKGVEVITFQVSRTWNPKLAGISGDDRDLGVAVADLGRRGLLSVRGQ